MRNRILVVGQAAGATGYVRVLNSLLPHLCERWEVHYFGLNYRGATVPGPWTLHPNAVPGDIHGARQLRALIENLRPHIVWLVHDLYLHAVHARTLASFPEVRTVVYFPVDGETPRPEKFRLAAAADCLVLFTEGARRAVARALAEIRSPMPNGRWPALEVVPHGVDTQVFRLLPGEGHRRRSARAALFPGRPQLEGAFVILNANRNCVRKRIDLTLEAFAQFCRGKPDNVFLYLHMGMKDRGVDIERLSARLGIERRLLHTTSSNDKPVIDDVHLNLIYNACEVGLNTATGEGWGLVAFEHAATGAAQILPAHSTCLELWEGAAQFVPAASRVVNPFDFVDQAAVVPEDVAAALELLYSDRTVLAKLSINAWARAHNEEFRWPTIAARWDALFRRCLQGDNRPGR